MSLFRKRKHHPPPNPLDAGRRAVAGAAAVRRAREVVGTGAIPTPADVARRVADLMHFAQWSGWTWADVTAEAITLFRSEERTISLKHKH